MKHQTRQQFPTRKRKKETKSIYDATLRRMEAFKNVHLNLKIIF